jgi:hypothetical protein
MEFLVQLAWYLQCSNKEVCPTLREESVMRYNRNATANHISAMTIDNCQCVLLGVLTVDWPAYYYEATVTRERYCFSSTLSTPSHSTVPLSGYQG